MNSLAMSRGFQVLSLFLFALAAVESRAQLDSSSAILLRPGISSNNSKQNLDSSRYKIRAPESRRDDEDVEEKPGTLIATPVPAKVVRKDAPVQPTQPEQPAPAPAPEPTPVTSQMRELILGGSPEEIEEAKTQLHPQDPRTNVLDIAIAPAYFYNMSNSGYSFRRYHTDGPGVALGANLWLTPFFGLQSRFFSSFSSGIRSGGTNMVPMDVQTFEAGVRFRKHFGYSRKAAQLSWGLDYHDSLNKIASEATTATGRKSAGLSVALSANIPTSVTYAHTMQIDLRPRLQHTELSTDADAKSGSKAETNAVSLTVGGEWTLDRRNQLFWRGQYSVERNLFKGQASRLDPHNNQTPDGVSVTNSLMIFYFGFKWGS